MEDRRVVYVVWTGGPKKRRNSAEVGHAGETSRPLTGRVVLTRPVLRALAESEIQQNVEEYMESDVAGLRQCEDCGGDDDLYLTTLRGDSPGAPWVLCPACRVGRVFDVAVPFALVTPRLVLGLQRLRKLEGNLSRLLSDEHPA